MKDLKFDELPEMMAILIGKVEDLEKTLQLTLLSNEAKNTSTFDRWFTLDELREYLPEHPAKATIYAWVSARTIPHHKGSKHLRFKQSEIDKWIAEGKRKSESELEELAQEYLSKNKKVKRYE